MKFIKHISIFVLLIGSLVGFSACSETEESNEFDNWQQRNVEWLTQIADSASNNLTNTTDREEGKWLILKSLSLSPDVGTPTITQNNMKDYIYVKIISSGNSKNGSPLYTDSVKVDYRGWLMPSKSYKSGYKFDDSYGEGFNDLTNNPRTFTVKGVVSGWQTALQYMSIGDRWMIYIPQELAYGTDGSGSIPGYSTLRFDIYLDSFRHTADKVWTIE